MATRIDKSSNKFAPRIGPRVRARSSQSIQKPASSTEEQTSSQPEPSSASQSEQTLPYNEVAADGASRPTLATTLTPSDFTPSRIRQSTPSILKRQGRPFDSPAIKRSGTAFAAPTTASTTSHVQPKSVPAIATSDAIMESSSSQARPVKRPRTSSATPVEGEKPSRKRRMPKWEDDPEEEPVDFAEVTMAEICKDLGKGRKSARYKELEKDKAAKRNEARKIAKERRLAAVAAATTAQDAEANGENPEADGEMSTTARRGNAISVPIDPALTGDVGTSTTPALPATASAYQEQEQQREETPERVLLKESMYAPQLRLVNGNLVLDEESLVIDRTAEAASHGEGPITTVIESAATRYVNSASYSKKERSERWNDNETLLFFNGLSIWGTDFELIARMIPGRSRRQVKNKFNREERRDPSKITEALKSRKKLDIEEYADAVGVTFREDVDPNEFDLPEQTIAENDEDHGQQNQSSIAMEERNAAAREIAQAVVGTGEPATTQPLSDSVPVVQASQEAAAVATTTEEDANVHNEEASSSAAPAPIVAPAVQVGRGKRSVRPASQRLGRLRAAPPRAVSKS